MAREKGKKLLMLRRKVKNYLRLRRKVKNPKEKIKDLSFKWQAEKDTTVPAASGPESKSNAAASPDEEKEREKLKSLSGFIFMCNSMTKLECYQYRVFGLPLGKKEVVEQIKPGAKLFLFDFESKLLYGVYEATSAGQLKLEPAAFKGKFPAQVKFKILKECLPLLESSLRSVIKENYTGSKFKQELSEKQVENLLLTFRPLNASSSQPAPQALANASLLCPVVRLAMENPFRHTGRLPAAELPYLSGMHHRFIPPVAEHQPVSNVPLQHGYHRAAGYGEHANLSLDHQSLPATSNPVTHGVRDPLYLRSMAIGERTSHVDGTGSGMWYHGPPPQYGTSIMQRPLPLQRETLHQNSVNAYNYLVSSAQSALSFTQPQPLPAGLSQGTDPVISYYPNTVANQLGQ